MSISPAQRRAQARPDVGIAKVPIIRPPRVLLVVSGIYLPDFGGAWLRIHRTLLRMRDRYPMRVEMLTFAGVSTQPGWSAMNGLRICRLDPSTRPLGLLLSVGHHLRRARWQGSDVVYTISTGRLAYLAALWARYNRLPLVVEIISCNLHESRARQFAAGFFVRAATLVIAVSQPVAREIRMLGVTDERIWVRPNPVDISCHKLPSGAERDDERWQLGYADRHVVHILAGCITDRKNQVFAVDVIERLSEHHRLLIIGPVWPKDIAYAGRLRDRIAASPARDRIQLVDRFTDKLHRVMYAADCLWMPSLEEGLGNVMLEALCCGVPCVINQALGMDEHLQDGINGCQAPLAPEAWAQAVTALLLTISDADRRRAISAAARSRYDAARFDEEFYRRLLAFSRQG